MTTNNAPKCGRLLLKRAVSNEGSLSLIIAGKWKGKVTVPTSATVGVLKTHIAAAANMSTGMMIFFSLSPSSYFRNNSEKRFAQISSSSYLRVKN